jgi:hypothetical protein
MRTCLLSRYLETALIYLLISQLLHSSSSTRCNILCQNTTLEIFHSYQYCCEISNNNNISSGKEYSNQIVKLDYLNKSQNY